MITAVSTQFPIDIIKIDRSFVRDLARDSEDQAITRAIINMAKALGMTRLLVDVELEGSACLSSVSMATSRRLCATAGGPSVLECPGLDHDTVPAGAVRDGRPESAVNPGGHPLDQTPLR